MNRDMLQGWVLIRYLGRWKGVCIDYFLLDTEDASETDMATLEEEISEMKEQ